MKVTRKSRAIHTYLEVLKLQKEIKRLDLENKQTIDRIDKLLTSAINEIRDMDILEGLYIGLNLCETQIKFVNDVEKDKIIRDTEIIKGKIFRLKSFLGE